MKARRARAGTSSATPLTFSGAIDTDFGTIDGLGPGTATMGTDGSITYTGSFAGPAVAYRAAVAHGLAQEMEHSEVFHSPDTCHVPLDLHRRIFQLTEIGTIQLDGVFSLHSGHRLLHVVLNRL